MQIPFENLMSRAVALTRSGRLKDATAAIQAALSRTPPTDTPPAGAARPADGDIVDIEAREAAPDSVPRPVPDRAATAASPGRFIAGRHTDKAGTRAYKLFVPPAAANAAAEPLPLVVMLHGCTQNPDDFAAGTRMNEASLRGDAFGGRGFFVLYPEQAADHNPQRCWNWFKHNHQQRGRGEPSLLAGMVRQVQQQHAIDPQRIYVAGLSAGGAMAAILGDAYPDVFAAVGVHSGLPVGAARDLPSAFAAMQGQAAAAERSAVSPPTIVFHGDRDTTVHPVNGERVLATPHGAAAAAVEQQAQPAVGTGRTSTRQIHRAPDGRVVAEHWRVHGAGHAWAGGSANGSYTDPQGPDATAQMLRFFAAHALPARGAAVVAPQGAGTSLAEGAR